MRPWLVLLGILVFLATVPIFISIALSRSCLGGAACYDQAVLLPYLAAAIGLSILALVFGLLTGSRP